MGTMPPALAGSTCLTGSGACRVSSLGGVSAAAAVSDIDGSPRSDGVLSLIAQACAIWETIHKRVAFPGSRPSTTPAPGSRVRVAHGRRISDVVHRTSYIGLGTSDSVEEHMTVQRDAAGANGARTVPDATVARLATYLRVLTGLGEDAATTVSSDELAVAAGVNSAMLRKDLSFLGSYGIRGVGYDVATLTEEIARTLGLTVHRSVALIGVGNLGLALVGYAGFASRGFRIAALVDADPARVGTSIQGMVVRDIADLERVVADEDITIAVLATPAAVAQDVCNRLVAAGVTSILNFAPVVLAVPGHVDVRKVDLAAELQILSFHESRKSLLADGDRKLFDRRHAAPSQGSNNSLVARNSGARKSVGARA